MLFADNVRSLLERKHVAYEQKKSWAEIATKEDNALEALLYKDAEIDNG